MSQPEFDILLDVWFDEGKRCVSREFRKISRVSGRAIWVAKV